MRPDKGSKLLRKGRKSIANQPYLVTTSTAKREKIFLNARSANIVLESLKWQASTERILLNAAVVMPDHVHFLATLKNTDLAHLMRTFKNFTARKTNEALDRQGPVWQRHYHDHAIRKEEDLNEVILYVLNNPVRAGLVKDFHDYPFWYCRWEV